MKATSARSPLVRWLLSALALWVLLLAPAHAAAPILKAGPVMTVLASDGAFRTLASDALVRNADDFARLVTLFHRLDGEDTAALLTTLSQEVLESKLHRAVALLGDGLDEASVIALRDAGKADVVAYAAAKADWWTGASRRYRDAVLALGAEHSAVLKFDEFADVPGSAKLLKRRSSPSASLEDAGVQFELSMAQRVRGRGETVQRLGVDLSPGEVDVVTDLHAIEVKGGDPSNELGELADQVERLKAFAQEAGKAPLLVFSGEHSPLAPRVAKVLGEVDYEFLMPEPNRGRGPLPRARSSF
jgi:hypothetical protein